MTHRDRMAYTLFSAAGAGFVLGFGPSPLLRLAAAAVIVYLFLAVP